MDQATIRNSCCYVSGSSRRLGIVGVVLFVSIDTLLFGSRIWHVALLLATLLYVSCSYEADAMLHYELTESPTEEMTPIRKGMI